MGDTLRDVVGKVHVVLVQEHHKLTAREFDSLVVRSRLMPRVGRQVKEPDTRIIEAPNSFLSLSVAAISNDDQLPVFTVGVDNAPYGEGNHARPVVSRNDYACSRFSGHVGERRYLRVALRTAGRLRSRLP